MAGAHGGRRAGAGRKPTAKLEKEQARALLREMVMANLGPLVEAQMAAAKGVKYLVRRNKRSGRFVRVTEEEAGKLELGGDEEIVEVWEKDPSVQAFTDLMNRTIDKPIEQVQADVTANVVYRWKDEE